jgi:hypothetical protein
MNGGNEKVVYIRELNQRMLYVAYKKSLDNKAKIRALDLREVYAVHYKDSARVITYVQDTFTTDSYMDVESMGRYVNGEKYAIGHYKAPWVTVGGTVAGFTGPMLINFFYGLLVPAAYTGTLGVIPVSTRKLSKEQPELYADPYFVAGYKQKARKKKVKNALWGSLVGIGAAVITTSVYWITNPSD